MNLDTTVLPKAWGKDDGGTAMIGDGVTAKEGSELR